MVVVIEGLEGGEVFGQTLVRSRDLVWVSVLLLRSYRTFILAGYTFFVFFRNHAIVFGAPKFYSM